MDNMHWNEATQTWHGHAQPKPMESETVRWIGWNKPLLIPNEWFTPTAAQPLHSLWQELQGQALGAGGQGALHQLVQAMAAFAPSGAVQLEPWRASEQQQMMLWVADGSRWA